MKEISKEEFIEKQRTISQNKAMYQYFKDVAREANNAGIDVRAFVKNIEASVTPTLVKAVWVAISKAMFGKEHTAELTTVEVPKVYEEVNKHIAQWGLEISFPSWADITYTKK